MSAATRELRWHGRTDLVRLMLLSNGWTEPGAPVGSGARVLRPIKDVVLREADGVTYVLITLPIDQQLDMPDGVSETSPELSRLVVGVVS